jgi:hypothetical protein
MLFSCEKKSAGIPEDFAADFVLRSYFLRILHQESFPADFKFSEKSAGISKNFPVDLATILLSCRFSVFRKIRRYT